MHLGNMNHSVQAWVELSQTTLAAAWAKACPQAGLTPRGTYLRSRTRVVQISSREGRLAVLGASVGEFDIAALRAGWHVGQKPFDRREMIFPHTPQEHRLWASKKACGTAPLKRPAWCSFKWPFTPAKLPQPLACARFAWGQPRTGQKYLLRLLNFVIQGQ